jgi:hypothetical protein
MGFFQSGFFWIFDEVYEDFQSNLPLGFHDVYGSIQFNCHKKESFTRETYTLMKDTCNEEAQVK